VCKLEYKTIKLERRNISLTKLKEKALKLDFKVARLDCQKLIKKNEVKPINSHPKNKVKKLLAKIRITILSIKEFNQKRNPISSASFLK